MIKRIAKFILIFGLSLAVGYCRNMSTNNSMSANDIRQTTTTYSIARYDNVDLVSKSNLIAIGHIVEQLSPAKTGEIIFTDSRFQIEKVYKGDYKNNQIVTVRTLGGTYGNEVHSYVDEPVFEIGDRYLLFLMPEDGDVSWKDDNVLRVTGITQGFFEEKEDNNQMFANYANDAASNELLIEKLPQTIAQAQSSFDMRRTSELSKEEIKRNNDTLFFGK